MSQIISYQLGWMANIFVLSAFLFGCYKMLVLFNVNAQNRFLFLKISFVFLPFYQVLEMLKSYFLNGSDKYSVLIAPSLNITETTLKLNPVVTSFQWGWLAIMIIFMYLLIAFLNIGRLIYSAWSIFLVKKHSEPKMVLNSTKIYIHEFELPPAVVGFIRPKILISKKTLQNITEQELNLIIQHEQVHIQRKDPIWMAIQLILKALFIFSPFILLISKYLEEDMELSVDEILLMQNSFDKKMYASLLLRLSQNYIALNSPMYNGFFKSKLFVKKRMDNIKNTSKFKSGSSIIITLLILFISFSFFILPSFGLAQKSQFDFDFVFKEKAEIENYCLKSSCTEDFNKALVSAKDGVVDAENDVGTRLHFGNGIKKNYSEALRWYKKAAENKHAEAANHIGRIYLNGEGVPKDPNEACKWYLKSANWGHAWGMMNAASCYEHGNGIELNKSKAAEWYAKAEKAQPGILKNYEELLKKFKSKK